MSAPEQGERPGGVIGLIERVGNRVPHPFYLFWYLLIVVGAASAVLTATGATAQLPGAPTAEPVRNILSVSGLQHLLTTMVDNFIGFPPLGVVLTVLLGVGVAERTGFLRAVVAATLARVPARLMPFAVVYVAGQGHFMGDAAMVILPPLAALAFRSVGRHPVAGAIGAFAATAVGYGSGLIVGALDANLAALSERVLPPGTPPGVETSVLMNYYIQVVAALILPAVVGWILVRFVEPGLAPYRPEDDSGSPDDEPDATVTPMQRRALRIALLATTGFVLVVLAGWLVPDGPLQGDDGALIDSPFFDALVPLIMMSFLVVGITYGALTGVITRAADVPGLMAQALTPMLGFVVIAFSAGQFIEMFSWSRVGTWLAVEGSAGLRSAGLDGFPALMIALVLCSVLAMLIFSGASLWAVLAPVLIPVFVGLGLHPAVIQATYRIGDSITNPISPLNPYLYVLLSTTQRYDSRFTLGMLFSRMALFVVPVTVLWVGILALFFFTGTPMGPGTTIGIGG
ncbi:aminobenzoyl-glutamate transport protein [Pseudonocardia sediminis]|uniref:Aminobenzoyl-glutamate transport protein n=1 Tax=Pseudonocardia sediminis TaxID=1397368 RepID=A0A4Q7UZC8_PSEST|nr:AbgT family transporter [Pseudonocardia sediminis]RZT87145.1 aminobenzoyl-glutamate transport protein [Pseudonocardia sediminis]